MALGGSIRETVPIMLALVLASAFALLPAASFGLTLDEAAHKAIQDNPDLAAYTYEWEAAAKEKARVTSLPDPAVDFAFGQSGADFGGDLQTIGVSQKILFPTKITASRARAEAMSRVARARVMGEQLRVVKMVKQAYVDLLLVDETIRIYRQDLSDARLLEQAIRRKYEVGRATQHDLIKAQIEAHLLEDQIQIREGDDRIRETARLRTLLNMGRDELLGDLEWPEISLADIDTSAIRSAGVIDSPELRISDNELRMADRDLSLARMDWVPDLNLRFFSDERDMMMGRNKSRGVMVSLNVPLWFWKNSAQIGRKTWLVRKAQARREATEDGLRLALDERLASFAATRRSYHLFGETIIPESELAYASAQTAYETGKMDILSLLAAQRALRDVKLSHLRLWAKLAKDLAEIERLTGLKIY